MKFVEKQHDEGAISPAQIEKLGNAIIYLIENIKPLYKTKLLKLIYLIEEVSVKQYGIPFFGLDFQLWKLGPVAKDVFIDLSSTPSLLKDFIEVHEDCDRTFVVAKKQFSDDEFSDIEISILEKVTAKFKYLSADELIKITHREHSPWHDTAKATGYLEMFEKNLRNSSDIVIDLSTLLDDSPEQKMFYLNTLEFQRQTNHLKGII